MSHMRIAVGTTCNVTYLSRISYNDSWLGHEAYLMCLLQLPPVMHMLPVMQLKLNMSHAVKLTPSD